MFCGQVPGAVVSTKVRVGVGSHASLAVGALNTGAAGHSMVAAGPTPLITGSVVSTTVMVWLAVVLFPQSSIAVQVRVCRMFCGQVPGAVVSTKVRVGVGSHASDAEGELNTGAAGHSMVDAGPTPLITGSVVSTTVMVWLAVLLLPQSSMAVQVRVRTKFCGQLPGAVLSEKVRVGVVSHASAAVGVENTIAAVHSRF